MLCTLLVTPDPTLSTARTGQAPVHLATVAGLRWPRCYKAPGLTQEGGEHETSGGNSTHVTHHGDTWEILNFESIRSIMIS